MDRYYYSNMAYQGARGLNVKEIQQENEKFAPVPDLVIILDVDPQEGMERVNRRNSIVDHFENVSFWKKLEKNLLKLVDYRMQSKYHLADR